MYSQPTARSTTTLSFASDLDALVAETMAEWKIPGLALAVVQSGDVALLKAYGYRDVEAELPVTINTHFSICSITKTFTSTGLALLVDQGRLDWTKPVREYIPEFRMLDPIATDRVTVRDLLCHHPGYGRIVITRAGDDLHWAYRGMSALLSHRHYDTFELPEIPGRLHPDGLAISFTTCRDGSIASLSAPFEPMVKDIIFIRCPAGDCLDAAFREACTGRFSDGPTVHFVTLDADGQLLLKPDFQPANRLRPYGDSTFENVEAKGVKVEFRRGENGRVTSWFSISPAEFLWPVAASRIAQRDTSESKEMAFDAHDRSFAFF